ncbi:hypothetical protein NP233_g10581 [Leucocoprinus birnbaumii]|uniref:Uncharacterized protein n=1 Tax=Leucocoprinus birnbaumii TaxID=56174 RepID=A0AAD5VI36_9AGAR|nr:hypothetical protein NP233_g10581 [Leucocoprinus birnbaumii]
MAPSAYSFMLQKGITGGFAPPTPEALHTVNKEATNTTLLIASQHRPIGESSLQPLAPKNINHSDAEHLVDELHTILKDLPTEQPPGSQDIYGLDTSIAWQSDDLEWYNGGPQGCGGGESSVQATDEQKAKFKRAVEIVNELVGK